MGKKAIALQLEIDKLKRKTAELEAQLIHVYHFADRQIGNASRSKMMGSGIIVQMTHLGGKEVCPAFMLKDGLSDETIAALKADLKYSFDKGTEFKP